MANNNFKQAMKELLGSEPAPQPAAPRDGDDGSIHLTL